MDKDVITAEQLEEYNRLMIEAIKRISAENIRKIQQEKEKKLETYTVLSNRYLQAS